MKAARGADVRYQVVHETCYRYAAPVSLSQHVLHVSPRACDWQKLHAAAIDIAPTPQLQRESIDPFGNPQIRVAFEMPHTDLRVTSRLDISVGGRPWAQRTGQGLPWEQIQAQLLLEGVAPLEPRRYRFESPGVRVKHELAAYALPSFTPQRPLLEAVADLVTRINKGFRYEPHTTTVGTSVMDVLAGRRGVCQDFAHLAIGCLRSLGLAARYVSGYLCTEPPPGEARLAGADATHAWFSVWCPDHGWVEFDPTNDCEADNRYLLVAWGRDFGDVSPLRGVIQGGGGHTLSVSVTVAPVAEG